jgi:hypothetical protein
MLRLSSATTFDVFFDFMVWPVVRQLIHSGMPLLLRPRTRPWPRAKNTPKRLAVLGHF